MDYRCGYYWTEQNESSVILKQLEYRSDGLSVVFACIAEGKEGRCFTEAMLEWFHNHGVSCCRRGEQGLREMEYSLKRQINKRQGSLDYAAVLVCVGELFLLWRRGRGRIWLLNTRFGTSHHKNLFSEETEAEGMLLSGVLEQGIGILLATEAFGGKCPDRQMESCLFIKELDGEERLTKRLGELGEQVSEKGGKKGTAVLVVTCREEKTKN